MSKKMPENYETVMNAVKEKYKNNKKLNDFKPYAQKTVEAWDKLSETQKKTISILMPLYDDFVEALRKIV